jgi:hypothetical protein
MAKKKIEEKVAAPVKEATKKVTVKKAPAKKAAPAKKEIVINAELAGFKAGDVYNALAAEGKSMSIKAIAKAAKISEEEVLVGMGWLFKEGKIKEDGELIALA